MTPGQLYEVDVDFAWPTSVVVPKGYERHTQRLYSQVRIGWIIGQLDALNYMRLHDQQIIAGSCKGSDKTCTDGSERKELNGIFNVANERVGGGYRASVMGGRLMNYRIC